MATIIIELIKLLLIEVVKLAIEILKEKYNAKKKAYSERKKQKDVQQKCGQTSHPEQTETGER